MRHTQTLIAISGSDVYPKAPHLIVFFTRLIKLFGFFFSLIMEEQFPTFYG